MGTRTVRTTVAIGVLAVGLLLAACGDGDDDGAGSTTTAEPTTSSAEGTSSSADDTSSSTEPSDGCPPGGGGVPSGAPSAEVVDVDGDGQADTAWIAGTSSDRRLGITTASGASFDTPINSASPIPAAALVANADEAGPVEVFLSDGRTVFLYVVQDCSFAPVENPEGEQYLFDLGPRATGTGLGCVDVDGDGRQELVGLNAVVGDGGRITRIDRTVVELEGTSASNGSTDRIDDPDDAAADLARTVTCGDLTIAEDGVHQAEPG
jgi:hypothetical protein